jgi:hypothetical protein
MKFLLDSSHIEKTPSTKRFRITLALQHKNIIQVIKFKRNWTMVKSKALRKLPRRDAVTSLACFQIITNFEATSTDKPSRHKQEQPPSKNNTDSV